MPIGKNFIDKYRIVEFFTVAFVKAMKFYFWYYITVI